MGEHGSPTQEFRVPRAPRGFLKLREKKTPSLPLSFFFYRESCENFLGERERGGEGGEKKEKAKEKRVTVKYFVVTELDMGKNVFFFPSLFYELA